MYVERLPYNSCLRTSLGELITECCTAVTPLDIHINDVCLCVFAQDRALGVEARTKEHGNPFRALVHCCECSSDSFHQCDRGLVTRMTRTEVTEPKAAKTVLCTVYRPNVLFGLCVVLWTAYATLDSV